MEESWKRTKKTQDFRRVRLRKRSESIMEVQSQGKKGRAALLLALKVAVLPVRKKSPSVLRNWPGITRKRSPRFRKRPTIAPLDAGIL
jgi:hypothetical protein